MNKLTIPPWLRKLIWPAISLGLVCYFFLIPVYKVGLWSYLGAEKEMNPITAKIVGRYLYLSTKSLSKEWYERVTRITEEDMPQIEWEEDSISSQGVNSFYCLDQQSDDVRSLLMPEWNLPYDKSLWWNARKTNEYLFAPEASPLPIYNIERTDSTVHIKTGTKFDTWVYLVAKEKQPEIYSIEFDFTTHTKVQETLQICFASSSLASRFRFNLENNETMKFDVVDHGNFLYGSQKELWKNHRFSYSIPLHQTVHVKLVCIENQFALYYDHELVMAVEVKDYEAKPNYWYLIFWNGTSHEEFKGEQDNYMDIEVKNFKIFHQRS